MAPLLMKNLLFLLTILSLLKKISYNYITFEKSILFERFLLQMLSFWSFSQAKVCEAKEAQLSNNVI